MERKIEIFVSGSTNPYISNEYYQAAISFGQMLNHDKYNIIFDGCHGLPGVVAEQFGKFSENLSIVYTSNYSIHNDWP